MDASNRNILIVGGGSGMGRALAARCLEAGARVVIAGRSEGRLKQAAEAMGDPPSLGAVAVDIAQETQVADMFRRIGPLDHIVSTAADIEGAYELLPSLDLKAAQRVVESKFYGPLLLAKHGAPMLSAAGSITFTSGIAAYRPAARGSVVAAINAALEGLVRALAIELAPIRVNAVSPGWVDTPIWDSVAGPDKPALLEAMADKLPIGRIGHAEEVADALAAVMSNGFINGTVLHVDGGQRLV